MKEEDIKRMMSLFSGYEKAHGTFEITGQSDSGKTEGRAVTLRSGATEADWERHLRGQFPGIGIVPLHEDDNCSWGALDIDDNRINHQLLEKQINFMGLPLVVFRSKSGGAHVFVFFSKPYPAQILIKRMKEFAAALGFSGCEVFPKQSSRADENDVGNWLNMPYFKAEETLRYCMKDGDSLDFEEMLDYCESRKISHEEFDSYSLPVDEKIEDLFEGGPPCLKGLLADGGFPDGTRNEGMFNVGVYLRKRYPDDWESHIQTYNAELCDPPLKGSEVDSICKSLKRKESYEYKCKSPPIESYCNRSRCLACPFGIGNSGEEFAEVVSLTRVESDPVVWYVGIQKEGEIRSIPCSSEELQSNMKFQLKCMEKLGTMPARMRDNKWTKMLQPLMSSAIVVQAPEEATEHGSFMMMMSEFLTERSRADRREELVRHVPWHNKDEKAFYFTTEALRKYMATSGLPKKSTSELWRLADECFEAEAKRVRAGDKQVRVWVIQEGKLRAGSVEESDNESQ